MSDNAKRVLFKVGYYLVTLVSFGLLVWALRNAYHYTDLHLVIWILVYIAIAVYIFLVVWLTKSIKRGFNIFVAHSALLQIVPIVATILIFCYTPDSVPYEPIGGSVRTYEKYFNDLQPKQKAAALANGLAPFKSRAEIEERYRELRRKDKLVHIETNSKYAVRELTHSSPYIVPKVEELLNDIADSF